MKRKRIRISSVILTAFWVFAAVVLLTPTTHAITYTYDNLNRLTKAEYKSGLIIEYEYDAGGNILSVRTTEPDRALSVAPALQTVPAESGITTFDIANTGADPMNWTATVDENDTWLTITGSNSGTDNGTITVRYEANPDDARIGRITIRATAAKGSPRTVEVRQQSVDTDGDGVADDEDVFPDDPNEWSDNDEDEIGDNADPDDDNDQMPDECENQYEALDPFVDDADEDPDGDGFTNIEECNANTDPDDPNDYPVVAEFTPDTQIVKENVGQASITVTLNHESEQEVTVPFAVTGTAIGNGTDHDLARGTIIIPAGKPHGTTTFDVIFDLLDEPDETVIVTMGEPVNAFPGSVTTHTVIIEGNTPFDFTAGVFTAGESGNVGIEWLYDGGAYRGQLGIFSLRGMGAYLSDMTEFTKEAVKRVVSEAQDGYVVFSDPDEGARFSEPLGGESRNWNSGPYNEEKFFEMRPNDRFAVILIPNATFEAVENDPGTTDPHKRPLFSLASSNPEHGMYLGQITDINGLGHAFVYEDILFSDTSDRDYNDFIFQVSGARGDAPPLDEWIDPEEDWRDSELGELMVTYIDEAEETLWKTVAFTADPHGTIGGEASQTVEVGQNSTPVTAVPKEGYRFTGWTGDHTGTENPLTLTNVSDHLHISANFEIMEYQVLFKAGANGTLTGETSQQVKHGDGCTQITAVPDDGYHFSRWNGGYKGDENPLKLNRVTADMNITANFEINKYTVTFAAETGGKITGETSQSVPHGGSSDRGTAVPDDGYHFSHWSGDYEGDGNPLTLGNVTADMNVTANFEINKYAVSFAAENGGKITGETSQTVSYGGSPAGITAVPDDGYHFSHWSGDYEGTDNPPAFWVAADMNVTANFERNEYAVTFAAEIGGTITGQTSQKVTHGKDCGEVTAVPDTGYSFAFWSGGHIGTDNPLTLGNVTGDMTVTANFVAQEYEVTFTVGPGGKLTGETFQSVKHGDDCSPVTVIPETGSRFLGWIGDHSGTGNPLTLTGITGDMTVTASFGTSEYTVNIIAGENGEVVGETSQVVEHGSDASPVTAEPADGYRFGGWSGDHTGTENPLTLEEITRDYTIQAVFNELGQYTVITHVSGNGTVDPSGNIAVTEGDDQSFTVTPGDDAVISEIEADGVSVTEEIVADDAAVTSYTFTAVDSDHILKVTFTTVGDISGDGAVGLEDAILALKILAGISVEGVSPNADVDSDQKIGLAEVIYSLQIIAAE